MITPEQVTATLEEAITKMAHRHNETETNVFIRIFLTDQETVAYQVRFKSGKTEMVTLDDLIGKNITNVFVKGKLKMILRQLANKKQCAFNLISLMIFKNPKLVGWVYVGPQPDYQVQITDLI